MKKPLILLAALLSLSTAACSYQYPEILQNQMAAALPPRPNAQAANLNTAAGITGPAGVAHDNNLQFIPQFMRR